MGQNAHIVYTTTKIPFMYSFSGNCAASVPIFLIHVSVSDLYIPGIGSGRIGRSIVGILIAHRHMVVENGTVAAKFPEKEYLFRIFGIGSVQCTKSIL